MPIIVTESSRIHLWRLVYFLGCAEALAGVTLIILVLYPISTLTKHLPARELLLNNVYYAQLFLGVTVTIASIDGILVNCACLYNPFLTSTKTAFRVWYLVGLCLTGVIIICIVVIPTAMDKSGEELVELLQWGSRYYLTDLSWKRSFDSIHQDYKCCGVNSVNDWLTNRWIPLELLRPEIVDLQDSVLEDGSFTVRVVPSSCCDPDLRVECFHDFLQQNRSGLRPELISSETVFTRGCGQLILDSVHWVTPPFMALTSVIVTFKIGQLFIGRCLYNLIHRTEVNEKEDEAVTSTVVKTSRTVSVDVQPYSPLSTGFNTEQFTSLESSAHEVVPVYTAQNDAINESDSTEENSEGPEKSELSAKSESKSKSDDVQTMQQRVTLRPARILQPQVCPQTTLTSSLPAVRITPEAVLSHAVVTRALDESQMSSSEFSRAVRDNNQAVRSRRRANDPYEYDLLQPVDFSKLL